MGKKKEQELQREIRKIYVLERQKFLDVYNEFDKWLINIGYRTAEYFGENSMTDNNIFANKINSLYGVEHYIIDALDLDLYFVRERDKHIFYFVHGLFERSEEHTLEQFKSQITKDVKRLKENKIKALDKVLSY